MEAGEAVVLRRGPTGEGPCRSREAHHARCEAGTCKGCIHHGCDGGGCCCRHRALEKRKEVG